MSFMKGTVERCGKFLLAAEGLAETIADQPERRADEQDRDARIGHEPPVLQEEIARLAYHEPPFRIRRLHTQPEERE